MNQSNNARPGGLNIKLLGFVTLVGSPAVLIEFARYGMKSAPTEHADALGAALYALFSIGWLAGILGLRQLNAAGTSKAARGLLNVVVFTVTLAILQSLMDVLRVPVDNVLYIVTDLAWPLSMVLTFAVSVAVLFARVLPLWQRLVPLYCGITLPIGVIAMAVSGQMLSEASFAWHTFTGWALLGLILILSRPAARVEKKLRPAL